jgi:hypothetical protein
MGQPPATAAAAAVATMAAAVTMLLLIPSFGSAAHGGAGGVISRSGTTGWGGICICVCTPHAHRTWHRMRTARTHRMHVHVRTCRYNLMEHVGAVSTLRDEPHPESLPRCNDFLGVSASFESSESVHLSCRRQTLPACLGLPIGSEARA